MGAGAVAPSTSARRTTPCSSMYKTSTTVYRFCSEMPDRSGSNTGPIGFGTTVSSSRGTYSSCPCAPINFSGMGKDDGRPAFGCLLTGDKDCGIGWSAPGSATAHGAFVLASIDVVTIAGTLMLENAWPLVTPAKFSADRQYRASIQPCRTSDSPMQTDARCLGLSMLLTTSIQYPPRRTLC